MTVMSTSGLTSTGGAMNWHPGIAHRKLAEWHFSKWNCVRTMW